MVVAAGEAHQQRRDVLGNRVGARFEIGVKDLCQARHVRGLRSHRSGIRARNEQMNLTPELLRGSYGMQRRFQQADIVVFCEDKHGHLKLLPPRFSACRRDPEPRPP